MSARASRFVFADYDAKKLCSARELGFPFQGQRAGEPSAPTPEEARDTAYREALERRLDCAIEQLEDRDLKMVVVLAERLVRARETP